MITKAQRDEISQRQAVLRAWMGKRNSYHPSELPSGINPPNNDELTQVELYDWQADAPDKYFAYVNPGSRSVTTWTGAKLAEITWLGVAYRDKMGGKRQNFRATGTNGVRYAGTAYVSSGDCCRMRRIKH